MICPKCGSIMYLVKIEHRGRLTVYVYRCERCRHVVEVSYYKSNYPMPYRRGVIYNPWRKESLEARAW